MGFFETWPSGPKKKALQQLAQEKEILHGDEGGKEERGKC